MFLKNQILKVLSYFSCFFFLYHPVMAAAKKSHVSVFEGKRSIELLPIDGAEIELPDQSIHYFGEDFEASLITQLMDTGRFIVTQPLLAVPDSVPQRKPLARGYQWTGTAVPSARIRVEVKSLNLTTGSRGDRSFYGFDERFRNTYNSGVNPIKNEFPLRSWFGQTNWFGHTFDSKGIAPFDSRSGLDLGDGFQINLLFAWLTLKYASYHAELHLQLHVETPEVVGSSWSWKESEFRVIEVEGNGFYFDASGGYEQYSGAITVARRDAFLQAMKKAMDGSIAAIDRALMSQPLMAQVDSKLSDGTILLGTGIYAQVQPGIQYENLTHPGIVVEVLRTENSGSVARLIQGPLQALQVGDVLVQTRGGKVTAEMKGKKQAQINAQNSMLPAAFETIRLSPQNLSKPSMNITEISEWAAFLKSAAEGVFLPYRIARYFLYDQSYHSRADLMMTWVKPQESPWRDQIGLSSVGPMASEPVVVAIIDSGVDYNHPWIHDSIWQGLGGQYGWDFISNDSKPYDDHYHGTELASLVLEVAPQARIMPIKVFNPWGVTHSAALFEGFKYAIEQGADLILCGWATQMYSQAIEDGVRLAQLNQVPVVSAAGDFKADLNQYGFYPASLSSKYDNLLSVAAVNATDQILDQGSLGSNHGVTRVQISAPGEDLVVANPRGELTRASSSSHAASLVAGALARYMTQPQFKQDSRAATKALLEDAQSLDSLSNFIQQGRRLRLRL